VKTRKIKVLSYVYGLDGRETTVRDIARNCSINVQEVYKYLRELQSDDILVVERSKRKRGSIKVIVRKIPLVVKLIHDFEELNKDIDELDNIIRGIFGSRNK